MTDTGTRLALRASIEHVHHDFYKQLSESTDDPERCPFRTMKDIFMLAVCLGYRRGQRRPLSSGKKQIFHWTQFSEQVDEPILKAIAIAETGDIQVLGNQEEILQIAEEYANAGIQGLKAQIQDEPGQPLWNLVELVRGLRS